MALLLLQELMIGDFWSLLDGNADRERGLQHSAELDGALIGRPPELHRIQLPQLL